MSDPDPTRQRNAGRREVDRAAQAQRLPVATEPAPREAPPADPTPAADKAGPAATDAGVTAQLLGETPRRGLKGGPETLTKARGAYLDAEYSGGNDRRPKKGRLTKTEI